MSLLGVRERLPAAVFREIRARLVRPKPAEARSAAPLLIGHRGTLRPGPENTIEGCRHAIDAGADGVEVDVCVTADGRAVLWHDRDPRALVALLRAHAAELGAYVPLVPDAERPECRPVATLTLAELRASYGYVRPGDVVRDWLDQPRAAVRVATLEELFGWAGTEPRCRVVMLDVKLVGADVAGVPALIDCIARRSSGGPRVDLLCPDERVYLAVRESVAARAALEGLRVVADFELPGVLPTSRRLGVRHVSIGVTPHRSYARLRHDLAGARSDPRIESITVWTVNEPERIAELGRLGADAIITDRVERRKV